MPLLFDSVPPRIDAGDDLRSLDRLDVQLDQAVVEEQHRARARRRARVRGSRARRASRRRARRSASRTNRAPGTSSTRPSANLPMRILGPCRSAMTDTSRPSARAASRTSCARSTWSAALPWEKLSRTHVDAGGEHPAQHIRRWLHAGPSVATILVERGMAEADTCGETMRGAAKRRDRTTMVRQFAAVSEMASSL